jgi:uncharacterized repeat protein (TIGR01451 family)
MIRTRLSTRTGRGITGIRPAIFAGRVLGAALLLALAPRAALAQDAAADTVAVVNTARLTYTAEHVPATVTAVNTVRLARTAGVGLAPPRQAVIFPGQRRVLAHVLENRGNGADRFTLSASGPAGWTLSIHVDGNGDGVLDAGDAPVTGPVALNGGASAALLLVVDAPAGAPESEVDVTVAAASANNPAATASVVDRLTLRRPLAALRLDKTVDRAEAARGDTLAYALAWSNQGDAPAADALVADTLPRGLRYVAGSLRVGGVAVTDAPDGDAGTVTRTQDGRDLVRVSAGTLGPAAAGAATFRAAVAPEATGIGTLTNVAVLTAGDLSVRSTPVSTGIGVPVLEITKERMGADTVDAGAQVVYRITVANRSAVHAARSVVVTDTLPESLAFVSASPSVEADGQVVRWRIGTLDAGQTLTLELTVRAGAADAAVVNRAHVAATNAADGSSVSLPIAVRSFQGNELEIEKTAGVLEASVGEAVAYTLTLRNRGGIPLRQIVVTDLLPRGTRMVEDGVAGADSVRLSGRDVTFFLAGPLAPGAEHRIRYSLVLLSAPDGDAPIANRAYASAEGSRVRSDTATSWVRLRGGQPLASRVLVGKVWMDRDGDGRQGPGDAGVRGVEVWSADGQMTTTDAEGRFSFPDIRTGAHVIRLDGLSLPDGMRLAAAADGIRRVRVDGWTLPVVDFRLVPGSEAPAAQGAADSASAPALPTVPALRTVEEREAEARQAFVNGPAIRISAPVDGSVIGTNRVYVGLKGEPGAQARLYDGDRVIGEATLRGDGSWDFVGVQLAPGTHRLRAWMRSSWGRERWDSVAVHRSGAPAVLEGPEGPVTLRAEGRTTVNVPVRVLDEWGVPVTDQPRGGATARGARLAAVDADSNSLGWQAVTGVDGVLMLPLRGGDTVGTGEMMVKVADAQLRVPLTILPMERPLIATGAVQIGVGAAPESYGALAVRGAVGEQTAVTLTYDSRRADPETEFFARGYDLQEEGRYPTLGDNSERRTMGSATQTLSARVEHGLDWVELGDVETGGFSGSERLGGYRRSLTGAAARVGTGPVTWRAFGSYTNQALTQDQVRANGSSGPYRFGGPVRPGTERVAIEVRARENAARLVRRQELVRSVDYQVDYATGEVLLQRPIPSEDAYGNPVFVVALLERRSGDREVVGGLRMEIDAGRLFADRVDADSLGVAFFGVHDGAGAGMAGGGAARLFGAEVQLRRGGLTGVAEVLRSNHADSASVAGQARVEWTTLDGRLRLEGGWLRVGDGFASTLNPRLRSGLQEWSLGAEWRVSDASRIRLRHERQDFRNFGVERQSTTLTAEQRVAGRRLTTEAGVQADATGNGDASHAVGRATLSLDARTDVWVEASRGLSQHGTLASRPDHLGIGGSHRVFPWARVEGSQRWVRVHRDSSIYQVSGLMVRTDLPLGTRIWTGLERTAAEGATHAAVLGWNQSLALYGGWQFHSLIERRFGVDRAPLTDPVRALPFAQPERDRWSAGLGLEYLPQLGPRFAARHEIRGGDAEGWRFDLSGELPAGRSLALLTRHDWWSETRFDANGVETRRDRSLLGLALRPAGRADLNVLGKLEYRHTANPLAGTVLSGAQEEWRMIGATDAVWTPRRGLEVAGRWALRRTVAQDSVGGEERLRSTAHYLGGRVEQGVYRGLALRLDGRLLSERVTGQSRWSAAPSLTMQLGGGLEAEAGWRFGDLLDPDFAAWGRNGAFALISLRFTEGTLDDAAAFWRERIALEP